MYARLAYGTRALCRAACDARSRSPRAATRLKGRGYESINVVRVVKVRLCVAVPYKVHKAVNLIRGSGSEHTTHKHYTRTKKRLSGPYTLHRSRYKETRFTSKISTIFTAVSDGCGMVAVWRGWGVGPGLGARNAPTHTHTHQPPIPLAVARSENSVRYVTPFGCFVQSPGITCTLGDCISGWTAEA